MRRKARLVRGATARSRHRRPVRKATALLTAALASACVLVVPVLGLPRPGLVAGQAAARPGVPESPSRADTGQAVRSGHGGARYTRAARPAGKGGKGGKAADSGASGPLPLPRAERGACPASASACVDLEAHLAWLQSGGEVTYGPVRAEPGVPGTSSATPRGTFHVGWKAGPHFVSGKYRDPMPWATFFGPGGVAFHGGSMTRESHGCVHLTTASARYFQARLPIGAEVAVF